MSKKVNLKLSSWELLALEEGLRALSNTDLNFTPYAAECLANLANKLDQCWEQLSSNQWTSEDVVSPPLHD